MKAFEVRSKSNLQNNIISAVRDFQSFLLSCPFFCFVLLTFLGFEAP
jgi:hypothetical protein